MIARNGGAKGLGSISRFALLAALTMPMFSARGDAPTAAPTAAPAPVPAVSPATSAPTTSSSQRGTEQIMKDIDTDGKQLEPIFGSVTATLTNPAKRAAAAPKMLPLIQHMMSLIKELNGQDEQGQMIGKQLYAQLLPMALTFSDPQSQADATKAAAGSDPDAARQAKAALLMSSWWKSSGDAAAQTKLLDDATALTKSNSDNPDLAQQLFDLSHVGAATPEISTKLQDIITTNMKGDFMDDIKQAIDGLHKMAALVGKPLTITGTTVDGKPFTTDPWKGKVILVDFWATWCGPCKAELPVVKKMYADYHDKGLEVLGVSNDMAADDLTKYLAADPGLSWPQLFDPKAAAAQQLNPVSAGFGVSELPVMFLIDKKGICRSITASESFEEEIPKLIAEQ